MCTYGLRTGQANHSRKITLNLKEMLLCAGLCAGLAGCATPSASSTPRSTSDAVREVAVIAAGECKKDTEHNSSDFNACFGQKLKAAVVQIERYEKCVSAIGCRPEPGQ